VIVAFNDADVFPLRSEPIVKRSVLSYVLFCVPAAKASDADEPTGREINCDRRVIVSFVERVPEATVNVTGVVTTAPTRVADGVPIVKVPAPAFALAGATEVNTPKPREATATSAMRLKVVFVDICFLSISRVREFPDLGFG
jgi:hypothetical protein